MTDRIGGRIDRLVDSNREALVELTLELIRCRPSYVEGPGGIRRAQQVMRREIARAGLTITDVNSSGPSLREHSLYVPVEDWGPDFAGYVPGVHPIVLGRLEVNRDRPTLALSGHVDVEPVDDPIWADPRSAAGIATGRQVFGRGASDMLGGLASFVIAARVALQVRDPQMNLEIHSVADEELGGNGTLDLLENWRAPEYVVVGEPTSLGICDASLGFHHFSLSVESTPRHMAHSNSDDSSVEQVARAILAMAGPRASLADRIRKTRSFSAYDSNPLCIGKIMGGNDAATPPASCSLEGVAFSPPGMSKQTVMSLVGEALSRGGVATSSLVFSRMSFNGSESGQDTSLAADVAASLAQIGAPTEVRGFPSPCDMRLYDAFGSAGVIWGPGDLSVAHAPDESVAIDALVSYTRALARLIVGIAGE
jgi:acetylornithine deacetylase/succinyl-diaminopimelate desuccinylase-like protein